MNFEDAAHNLDVSYQRIQIKSNYFTYQDF